MIASPIILAAVFGSTALADTTILVPSSSEGRGESSSMGIQKKKKKKPKA